MQSKIPFQRSLFIAGSIAGVIISSTVIFLLTSDFSGDSLSIESELPPLNYPTQNLIVDTQIASAENVRAVMPLEQTNSSIGVGEATTKRAGEVTLGLPVNLKIPSIRVDALIEYVGLTKEGAIDVPKNPANVAWFELGPRPAGKGSAVIVGHFGWKSKPAVFDNLSKLNKGDKLYVKDKEGRVVTFVVSELRRYGKDEDTSGVFDSKDGKSHLILITCEGTWSKTDNSYSNRLIVFSDMLKS